MRKIKYVILDIANCLEKTVIKPLSVIRQAEKNFFFFLNLSQLNKCLIIGCSDVMAFSRSRRAKKPSVLPIYCCELLPFGES